jgi:hypothetical protein
MVSPHSVPSPASEEKGFSGIKTTQVIRNYGFHLLALLLGIALAFM